MIIMIYNKTFYIRYHKITFYDHILRTIRLHYQFSHRHLHLYTHHHKLNNFLYLLLYYLGLIRHPQIFHFIQTC